LRRNPLVLGDAFADSSLLDGEFDEFFLQPLHRDAAYRTAAMKLLRSFDYQLVRDLRALHRRISAPVVLVWGDQDKFFPVERAKEMVPEFATATFETIPGAGLFSHEERPAEVARALLPTLTTPR
jgi:pimeloyl-ACP methyl ester carboxylesterase